MWLYVPVCEICLCMYVRECALFPALCVNMSQSQRSSLFGGPRMWVPSLLVGYMSQRVSSHMSLWI